ncbi:MAG: iron-only hydrogenase system regulator [Peptococcaceae bacterium]|nr:iron-only hydrogenase system regulator [Peptococcaceae bacterium]
MRKVAIISAVLDDAPRCQRAFNDAVAEYRHLIKGRMGIPMPEKDLSLISLVALGDIDDIDRLTNRLGRIEGVSVKTAMSKKDF